MPVSVKHNLKNIINVVSPSVALLELQLGIEIRYRLAFGVIGPNILHGIGGRMEIFLYNIYCDHSFLG